MVRSTFKAKLAGVLLLSALAANCSGKTYSTFLQPFDLVFGGKTTANPAVSVGLASATPLSPTRVRVAFNKPVSLATAENTANYVITDPNGVRVDVLAVTRDPFDTSVIFIDTTLHTAGLVYTITASNLVGVDGAGLSSAASTGSYTAPNNVDATAPNIAAASMSSTSKLNITFNEAVDLTSSQVSANYTFYTNSTCTTTFSPTVSNLSRDSLNFAKVSMDLNTPNPTGGTAYYVRVNAVKDIWGNSMSNVCSPAWVGFGGAVAPKVTSAVSQSPSSVLVTFDSAMTITGASLTQLQTAGNYTFSQCKPGPATNLTMGTATVLNSTQVSLTALGNATVTAGNCKVTVASGTGILGSNSVALSATNNTAQFPYNPAPDTTSPAVGTVSAVKATTVRVTFNEPIQTPTASNFSFSPSLTVGSISCNAALTSCDITTGTQTTQSYTASISGIKDTAGNTMTASSTTFTGDGKPYIVGIVPIDATSVRVQWSEPILAAPAGTETADYALNNGVAATDAQLYPIGATSSDTVILTISPAMTSGTSYTLTYKDVNTLITDATTNNAVNPMSMPGSGVFTGPAFTTAPQVSSASASSATTIRVTFNEALDNSTVDDARTTDYAISGVGCPLSSNITSAVQVQSGVVQLVLSAGTAGPATCTLTVGAGNVANIYGATIAGTNNSTTFSYAGTSATDTTAPTILSAVALSSTQIKIFFSEDICTAATGGCASAANYGTLAANYVFSPSLTVGTIVCSGSTCTVDVGGQTTANYTLTVSNIDDISIGTNLMSSQSTTFYGTGGSVAVPTLYSATLINTTTVELSFSEQMDLARAQNAAMYTISGGQTVSAAVRQADATKVRLTFSTGAIGASNTYTVTGNNTASVTATTPLTDLAANILGSANTATFSGSSTAPSSAPDLAPASDTGASNTDNVTGNGIVFPSPGLVFTGIVAANTTVIIYDNGVIVGSTTSDSSGNYSVAATATPNPGQYSVATVSSTGIVSDVSAVISITFDNTASAAPGIPVLKAASDSGISNSDKITNATAPVFTVSCVTGESVQLYNSTSATGTAGTCASGTVDLTAGTLTAGTYAAINAKQTDTAGNQSPASVNATSFTIDTTAPAHGSDSLEAANAYLDITLSEGAYGSATAASALTSPGAFTLNFASNGGGVTAASITSLTKTTGAALTGGETTIRVNLSLTGVASGVETVSVTAASNAVYDNAGNASTFTSDTKTLNNASIANINAASYSAPATPGGTGSTTGYVDITFSQGAYSVYTPPASGALVAGDFTRTFTSNSGNATAATISCVTTVASTSCPGTAPAAGATQVRVILTFDAAPSGVETIQINAAANEIYSSSGGVTLASSTTGVLNVSDRKAPVISSVSPAASTTVTSTQVSYTLSETCASGSVVWTHTGGTADGNHTQALSGSELTAGTKTNITLTNNPTLVSGAIYTVAFNCTDAAGNVAATISKTLVTYDVTGPTVSSVTSSTANGTYGMGATISIQVVFNEAVTVNTTGGTPQLTLALSPAAKAVNYVSGSGTTTLNFTYTVATGESSSDLEVNNTSALSANGGTLKDAAGNDATLTLTALGGGTSLGGSKAIVIDGVAPTVTNVTSSTADGTYKAGQVVAVQVVFSEAVKITGTPTLTLTTTTPSTTRAINYSSGDGTNTLVFNYTILAGDTTSDLDYASTSALSGTITDNFSNNPNSATLTLASPGATNSLGANKAVVVDTTAPTVTGVSSTTANATYGTGAVISIQVTFSENVTVNGTPTLTLNTSPSRSASYVSGSGTNVLSFDYTVQSGDTSSDLDYAATGSLLAGTSIRDAALNDATLTLASPGAAGSLGANKDIVINAAVTFSITAAETMDCDPVDGIIDHYKITFGAAARDNTFDGYVLNAEGLPTGKWVVAGRSNVRLHHGTSLPAACGTDTANDTVVYIKFNQGASVDTGSVPDITGTNDTLTANSDGLTKLFSNTGNWTTTDVTEADKAGPYIYLATAAEAGASEAGAGSGDTLVLKFSEQMNAAALNAVSLDTIFQLNNSHTFGLAANTTSAWTTGTFTNDTLTITIVTASGTPVAVADTIKLINQATLLDNASNQPTNPTNITSPAAIGGTFEPGLVGPAITSATYLDTDADGYIDTVRVQFSTTVQDDTFPGYVVNSLGTVTTQWQVAGYNNVQLWHGTKVSTDTGGAITDTANDATIYLRFAEGSTYDTGVKPDLTATDQGLSGPNGGVLGTTRCYVNTSVGAGNCNTQTASDILTANVVESDGALPIIVKATAKTGATSVFISFSENVSSASGFAACGSGGQMVAADFTYVDGNTAAPNAFAAFSSSDTCATGDAFFEATANGTGFATGDLNVDKVQAASNAIYDGAGNAMSTSRQQVIAEATAPYVLSASSYYSGGKSYLRIFFSEAVSNASASTSWSALRAANYTVEYSSGTACPSFLATTPGGVTAIGGSNRVFDLQTDAQCTGTVFKVTALTTIKDIDEFENVSTPNFAYTYGTVSVGETTAPRLLLARSLSATTVELTYSEPMKSGDQLGSAECKSTYTTAATCSADIDGTAGTQVKYWITPTLGNVTAAAATADPSVYIVTHAGTQSGNFYTINAYASNSVTNIPNDIAGNRLTVNQAVFQGAGTPILNFSDGAVFSDPFSDGTKFNYAFTYQSKVYLGPNDKNNAAFRFEADGLNPVGVTFYSASGSTCAGATSFGITGGTCGAQTIGPNGENGIVAFNSGTLTVGASNYEILMLGPIRSAGVGNFYYTFDVDTQLDFSGCSISVQGGANIQSIQSSYVWGDSMYTGFTIDHGVQTPQLNRFQFTGSPGTCGAAANSNLSGVNYIGHGSGNKRKPASSTVGPTIASVDSMLYIPTGSSITPTNTFFIGSAGGIAATTGTPGTFSTVICQKYGTGNSSSELCNTAGEPQAPGTWTGTKYTRVVNKLEKIRPGEKAIPYMIVYKNAIYMVRNLAVDYANSTNSVTSAGGEIYKCTTNCATPTSSATNWTKVLDIQTDLAGGTNNKAISVLQVNGNVLYLGVDNPTDGVRMFRTTVASVTGGSDFALQGSAGLGNTAENQYFFSSASIRKGASNYIYVTVGDANLVAIKVLRQVD